jgi:hypothetical protein
VIDIGFGSAMIFENIVKLLRHNPEIGSIIRKVGIFLKPYLESIHLNPQHEQIELTYHIMSFVVPIWDQIHSSSSPYFVAAVEVELICLGLELIEYFAPLLKDTSFLMSLTMEYLSDSSTTFVDLITSIWLTGGPGRDSYKALSSFYQISSNRMKAVISSQALKAKIIPEYLEDLKDCIFSSKPYSNAKSKVFSHI